jgi:hypothetical protein
MRATNAVKVRSHQMVEHTTFSLGLLKLATTTRTLQQRFSPAGLIDRLLVDALSGGASISRLIGSPWVDEYGA